jgi:response regulator RpfG family c-di-GMP phosphodiesterase
LEKRVILAGFTPKLDLMNTQQEEKIRILYVDDEENNLQAFKATFRRDFKVFLAISAKEGEDILSREEIDLIITDQRMPEKWSFWKV